jgi:hypothetical protein
MQTRHAALMKCVLSELEALTDLMQSALWPWLDCDSKPVVMGVAMMSVAMMSVAMRDLADATWLTRPS